MFELLAWWNKESASLSPVLSSAILHYRFEAIHPFADGNGRTGRALALWELYRRGFDTTSFPWMNFTGRTGPYYATLMPCAVTAKHLTGWLEYASEGLQQTWNGSGRGCRNSFARSTQAKLVLRPRQEQLLQPCAITKA